MKRAFFTTALLSLLLMCSGVARGQNNRYPPYDFTSVNADGDTLYYRITSSEAPFTVAVTRCHDSIFHTLQIPFYEYQIGQPGFVYPVYDYDSLISIPSNVTHNGVNFAVTAIDNEAFYMQKAMRTVIIPSTVTIIDTAAFFGSSVMHVEMPNVTHILYGAFENSYLSSVDIPECITVIEQLAFAGNPFTTVRVPSSITVLEKSVFAFCEELSQVNLPDHLDSIKEAAFYGTHSLKKITIPSEVTYIGPEAFTYGYGSYGVDGFLDTLIMECATPPEMNDMVCSFQTNKDLLVVVPCHASELYQTTPIWSYYSNFTYHEDCTGVEEYEQTSNVTIAPNPVTDVLHVSVTDGEIARIEMFDAFGRIVPVETHGRASLPSPTTTVNTSDIPSGLYVLRVTLTDGTVRTTKIVKR